MKNLRLRNRCYEKIRRQLCRHPIRDCGVRRRPHQFGQHRLEQPYTASLSDRAQSSVSHFSATGSNDYAATHQPSGGDQPSVLHGSPSMLHIRPSTISRTPFAALPARQSHPIARRIRTSQTFHDNPLRLLKSFPFRLNPVVELLLQGTPVIAYSA